MPTAPIKGAANRKVLEYNSLDRALSVSSVMSYQFFVVWKLTWHIWWLLRRKRALSRLGIQGKTTIVWYWIFFIFYFLKLKFSINTFFFNFKWMVGNIFLLLVSLFLGVSQHLQSSVKNMTFAGTTNPISWWHILVLTAIILFSTLWLRKWKHKLEIYIGMWPTRRFSL